MLAPHKATRQTSAAMEPLLSPGLPPPRFAGNGHFSGALPDEPEARYTPDCLECLECLDLLEWLIFMFSSL